MMSGAEAKGKGEEKEEDGGVDEAMSVVGGGDGGYDVLNWGLSGVCGWTPSFPSGKGAEVKEWK